jgi:thymidylate synthase
MNNLDRQYFELLNHILDNGYIKIDRTGTGTKSIFDYTIKHKMSDGFPLLTSKKIYFKGVVHELLWFLRGETNIKYLVDNNVNIWNGDAYKNYAINQETHNTLTLGEYVANIKKGNPDILDWADLGPVYGAQWRNWGGKKLTFNMKEMNGDEFPNQEDVQGIDQISDLISELRKNPDSRRLIVSAWNVSDISSMVLPPCHYAFQCYTRELSWEERVKLLDNTDGNWDSVTQISTELDKQNIPKRAISLKFTMRSTDVFLGLPFNLASYGLLLQMIANEVNMVVDELIFSGGDCHIYLNHIEQCKKQLNHKVYNLPKIEINKGKSIFDIDYNDIKLINYESSPAIKGELSN